MERTDKQKNNIGGKRPPSILGGCQFAWWLIYIKCISHEIAIKVAADMETYDLYRFFDGRTIVASKCPITKAVTIIRDWTCDSGGAPSMTAADHAHARRNAIIIKLRVSAVKVAVTTATLMSSFMMNLSPHPDGMSVFYKKHCSGVRMACAR